MEESRKGTRKRCAPRRWSPSPPTATSTYRTTGIVAGAASSKPTFKNNELNRTPTVSTEECDWESEKGDRVNLASFRSASPSDDTRRRSHKKIHSSNNSRSRSRSPEVSAKAAEEEERSEKNGMTNRGEQRNESMDKPEEEDNPMIVESRDDKGHELKIIANEDIFGEDDKKNNMVIHEKQTMEVEDVATEKDQPLAMRRTRRGRTFVQRFSPSPEPRSHRMSRVTDASSEACQKNNTIGSMNLGHLKRSSSQRRTKQEEGDEMAGEKKKDGTMDPSTAKDDISSLQDVQRTTEKEEEKGPLAVVDNKKENEGPSILEDNKLEAYRQILVMVMEDRWAPTSLDEIVKNAESLAKTLIKEEVPSGGKVPVPPSNSKESSSRAETAKNTKPKKEYEAERILEVMKPPKTIRERVFVLSWRNWPLSTSSIASFLHLRGCENLIIDFIRYYAASGQVLKKLRAMDFPVRRPLLGQPMREHYNQDYMASEFDAEAKEKATIRAWRLKEIERMWNKAIEATQYVDFTAIRLDYYVYGNPPTFKYISENVCSPQARKAINEMEGTKTCECVCGKLCDSCFSKINTTEVIFKGNYVEGATEDVWKERTFATLKCCATNKECSGVCKQWPKRTVPLLVASQPQFEGLGLFTLEKIDRGLIIGEYLGEVSGPGEKRRSSSESFQYSVNGGFVISASHQGNEFRYLNHSCAPNVCPMQIFEGSSSSAPRLFFTARREIQSGEELTIDYHPSLAWKNPPEAPVPRKAIECRCMAKNCRGFLQ